MTTIRFDETAGVYEVFTTGGTWLAACDTYRDACTFALEWENNEAVRQDEEMSRFNRTRR